MWGVFTRCKTRKGLFGILGVKSIKHKNLRGLICIQGLPNLSSQVQNIKLVKALYKTERNRQTTALSLFTKSNFQQW